MLELESESEIYFQGLLHRARTWLPRLTLSSPASSGFLFFHHGDYHYLKSEKQYYYFLFIYVILILTTFLFKLEKGHMRYEYNRNSI